MNKNRMEKSYPMEISLFCSIMKVMTEVQIQDANNM